MHELRERGGAGPGRGWAVAGEQRGPRRAVQAARLASGAGRGGRCRRRAEAARPASGAGVSVAGRGGAETIAGAAGRVGGAGQHLHTRWFAGSFLFQQLFIHLFWRGGRL